MEEKIFGVAIEDAHVSVGLVDLNTRKVVRGSLQRKRVNTNGTAEEVIAAWAKVINDVAQLTSTTISKIGLGLPGIYNYDTGVLLRQINGGRYTSLFQRSVKELLSNALSINTADIRMLSDSASFLQGEVFGGSGRGFSRSLGVTLGIGLGSAKYSNGKVENMRMYGLPFRDSIAEDYVSVNWLLRRYEALSGNKLASMLDLKEFAASDDRVLQVFEEFSQNLTEFIIAFIKESKINPEVIVVGGHMESFNRFFFDNTVSKIAASGVKTPVLRAVLGEEAAIIGAGSMWYDTNLLHS